MSLKTNFEFLFIGRGEESFLENYAYELSTDESGQAGRIFMNVEILNNQTEAETIAEAMFDRFKESFYSELEYSPYERFEHALKAVNTELKKFQNEKASKFIGGLNVIIAAFAENQLFLSQTGDAEAYLVRGSYVSNISEGLYDPGRKDGDVFMNIASGKLEEGDYVIFSSTRLLRYMTKTEFARIFQPAREPMEGLADLRDIIITEILGRIGVIGIKMTKKPVTGKAALTTPRSRFKAQEHIRTVIEKIKSTKVGGKVAEKMVDLRNLLPQDRFTKNNLFIVLIVVVVIFVLGMVWVYTSQKSKEEIAKYEAMLVEIQEMVNLAESKGQFDKEQASVILQKAEEKSMEILNAREFRSKASQMLDKINTQRALLDNVRKIDHPQVFVDLTAKQASINNLGLLFLKDRLFAFDFSSLYEIILDKIQDPLTIDASETAVFGTPFEDKDALVFATKANHIIEYRDGHFYFMDTADGSWKTGVDLKTYGSKLYLLDPERNKIWKYVRQRDGYGASEEYATDPDLQNAACMAIDGAVYVAKSDGTIIKFYAGKKEEFPVKKAPMLALSAPTKMFTSNELTQIYILEPANNRVLSYSKDPKTGGAIYLTQYVFEGLDDLRGLYVDQQAGKLYVADAKKVYITDL